MLERICESLEKRLRGLAPCVLCAVNCAPDLTTWSKGTGWSEQHKYSQDLLDIICYDFCALGLKTWCKCVQGWWQHWTNGQYSNTSLNRNRHFRSRLWIIIIILKLVQGQEGMNFSISAMHKLTCQHQLKRRKMTNFLSLRKNLFYIGGSGHAWSHANLTVLKVTHLCGFLCVLDTTVLLFIVFKEQR